MNIFDKITISICYLFFLTSCSMNKDTLEYNMKIISDSKSSYAKVSAAVQRLGEIDEPPSFWSDIANSDKYSKFTRRLCVVQLFKRHINVGFTLTDLSHLLNNPSWLTEDDIDKFDFITGHIPIESNFEDSDFVIRLFPKLKDGIWAIFFRVSGKVSKEELISVIFNRDTSAKVREAKVLEISVCDKPYPAEPWHIILKQN